MRAPPGGWRALGAFWALLGVGVIGGGLALDRLGAPQATGRVGLPPISEATPAPGPANAPLVSPQSEASTSPPTPPAADVKSPVETASIAPPPALAAPASAPSPTGEPPNAVTAGNAGMTSTPTDSTAATPPPADTPLAAQPLPDAPSPPPLQAPPRAVPQPDRPIAALEAGLQEAGRHGPLPRVGPDGRTSIRTYARAFDRSDTRPRIGIVLGGIGLSAALSEEAIRRLPGAVALAFSPYATQPQPLLDRARAKGMETLSALPMEPNGYPLNDPGDWAMLTGLAPEQNLDRMEWSLSRITGQVGAVGALGAMRGERFAAVPSLLLTLEDHLRSRGLLYIDPRPNGPSPERAWGRAVDLVIDEPATRGEIDRRLAELERIAQERGSALGIAADPAPVTVERLASWAAGLAQRGLVLAPVSVLIRRPEGLPR